ncbi:MAG: hypothetical protein G01um101433_346 [Parcubacteria group bacterium Gr01-1014_33]|nr:MAG: hypothetical protein G01um101433_346 [Parcubacteria group bacterium Gr01-1014_33]
MRITPFQKFVSISVLLVLLLGAVAFGFVAISGRVLRFGTFRQSIRERIEVLEGKQEEARKLSLIFREHRSEFDRMKKSFIDPQSPIGFVEQIEALGRATGNSVSFLVDEGKSDARSFLFNVEVKGTRENIVRMVRALEVFPYSLAFEEIRFRASGQDGGASREKKEAGNLDAITASLRVFALENKSR